MTNDPVETLRHEHRVIERALDALEKYASKVAQGEAEPEELTEFVLFFRGFADACHHAKEERIVFDALASHGVDGGSGPVATMICEHQALRGYLHKLELFARRPEQWMAADREEVVRLIRTYVSVLRGHIEREQRVLFPMVRSRLSRDAYRKIADDFVVFEQRESERGEHERLHRLAYALLERHAWPPVQTASAGYR
jgi:hemerythrin-like domain-containing protein